jgi:hypothetical protein
MCHPAEHRQPLTIDPDPHAIGFTKLQQVALTWLLALGLSALLVAAGQRWPQPLPIRAGWVWAALFGLPLLTLVAVLARWSVAAPLPQERTDRDP